MPTSGQSANDQSQRVRSSATMPQLTNYTKEDILEQYLSRKPSGGVGASSSPATGGSQKRRKLDNQNANPISDDEQQQQQQPRPPTSAQQAHRIPSAEQRHVSRLSGQQDQLAGKENISTTAELNDSPRGRSKSRRGDKSSGSRSRSLSLFSACFTIPNLSSMLSSSGGQPPSGSSGGRESSAKRSLLSHLGIQTQAKQRPISSSQTAGNLQQFSAGNDDMTPTGQRKHVSFEANRNRNPNSISSSATATATSINMASQQQQPISATPRGQQSNVILRNYQAHISPQPQLPPPLLYEQPADGGQQPRVTASQMATQPKLTYNQPISAAQQPQNEQQANHLTYHPTIRQQPKPIQSPLGCIANSILTTASPTPNPSTLNSSAVPSPSTSSQVSQLSSAAMAAASSQQQQYQFQLQQQQQQLPGSIFIPPAAHAHPYVAQRALNPATTTTTTIYKRLPSLPMRTQATQTEITAYHLTGATPPFSSASSSMDRRAGRSRSTTNQRDTPQSQARTPAGGSATSSRSASRTNKRNHQRDQPKPSAASSTSRAQPTTSRLGLSDNEEDTNANPNNRDSGDNDSDDDDVDGDEANECGNLNASLLAASGSSSSEVSLEGHDSTLATTLQYDALRCVAGETSASLKASKGAQRRPPPCAGPSAVEVAEGDASITTTKASERGAEAAKLKTKSDNLPRRDRGLSGPSTSGPRGRRRSGGGGGGGDIEPPSEFKDDKTAPAGKPAPRTAADISMNMNDAAGRKPVAACTPSRFEVLPRNNSNEIDGDAGAARANRATGEGVILVSAAAAAVTTDTAAASATSGPSQARGRKSSQAAKPERPSQPATSSEVAELVRRISQPFATDVMPAAEVSPEIPLAQDHQQPPTLASYYPKLEDEQRDLLDEAPSLSEASSQTDTSMAQRIIAIGLSLEQRQLDLGQADREEDEERERRGEQAEQEMKVHNVANYSRSNSSTSTTTLASQASELTRPYAELGGAADSEGDDPEQRTPTGGTNRFAAGGVERQVAGSSRDDELAAAASSSRQPEGRQANEAQGSRGAVAARDCARETGGADRRVSDTNGTIMDIDGRRAEPEVEGSVVRRDSGADNVVAAQQQQQQRKRSSLVAPPAATSSSPAEQRRDDFLTLTDGAGSESAADANPADPIAEQLEQQLVGLEEGKRSSTSTLSTRHHSYCSSDLDFNAGATTTTTSASNRSGDLNLTASFEHQLGGEPEDDSERVDNLELDSRQRLVLASERLSEIDESPSKTLEEEEGRRDRNLAARRGDSKDVAAPVDDEFGAPNLVAHLTSDKLAKGESLNYHEVEASGSGGGGDGGGGDDDGDKSGAAIRPDCGGSFFMTPQAATAATGGQQQQQQQCRQPEAGQAPSPATGSRGVGHKICDSQDAAEQDSEREQSIATKLASRVLREAQAMAAGASGSAQATGGPASSTNQLRDDFARQRSQASSQSSSRGSTSVSSASVSSISSAAAGKGGDPRGGDINKRTTSSSSLASSTSSTQTRSHKQEAPPAAAVVRVAKTRGQLSGEANSPPTTVSELDQDEELSTPSFVDSYQKHVAQVGELASEVVGQLLSECLADGGGSAANPNTTSASELAAAATAESSSLSGSSIPVMTRIDEAQQRAAVPSTATNTKTTTITPLAANNEPPPPPAAVPIPEASASSSSSAASSSSSSSNSSSTSASENSYVCCHPKDQQHETRRPKLPEKPAHLRQQQQATQATGQPEEAAAAVVVTATSIAAASSMVAMQQQQQQQQQQQAQLPKYAANGRLPSRSIDSHNYATTQPDGSQWSQQLEPMVTAVQADEQVGATNQQQQRQQQQPAAAAAPSATGAGQVATRNAPASRSSSVCSSSVGSTVLAAANSATTMESFDGNSSSTSTTTTTTTTTSATTATGGVSTARRKSSGSGTEEAAPASLAPEVVHSASSASSSSSTSQRVKDVRRQGSVEGQATNSAASCSSTTEENSGSTSKRATLGTNSTPRHDDDAAAATNELSPTTDSNSVTSDASLMAGGMGVADGQSAAEVGALQVQRADDATYSISEQQIDEQDAANAAADDDGDEMEKLAPIRQSSQELLSTVSECSEEMSTRGASVGPLVDGSGQPAPIGLPLRRKSDVGAQAATARQPIAGRRGPSAELANKERLQEANLLDLEEIGGSPPLPPSQVHENQQAVARVAPTLHQEPATEQDLANSEYTLRSQCSEAAALTSNLSEDNSVSLAAASGTGAPASAAPPGSGGQVANQLVRQSSAEQRRRSTGSSGSGVASQPGTRLLHGHHHVTAAKTLSGPTGVDCPYVHDIVPLSPQGSELVLSTSSSRGSSPVQPAVHQLLSAAHHKRLSHDDTMEAIEDDVEGEEQEMQELQRSKSATGGRESAASEPPLDIEPPPAFGGSGPHSILQVVGAQAEPIIEEEPESEQRVQSFVEEEEDDENDHDEESSISISQQHGVVVTQDTSTLRRKRKPREKTSDKVKGSPSSSSSSSTSSSSTSPEQKANEQKQAAESVDDLDDNDETDAQVTPVKSMSHDSATHAILEHLSLHHPGSVQLDEPPPAMETSAPIDPQLRRESWRRESLRSAASSKRSDGTSAAETGDSQSQREGGEHQAVPTTADEQDQAAGSMNPTGTMKRRASGKPAPAKIESQISVEQQPPEQQQQQQQRRGPPLARLKSTGKDEEEARRQVAGGDSLPTEDDSNQNKAPLARQPSEQQQQQKSSRSSQRQVTSGSVATDTSICSSCSCHEPSLDLSHQEAGTVQQQQQQQAPGGKPASSGGATWMSQEEGTVFTENYWLAHWLYISEHEESEIWRRAIDMNNSNALASADSQAQVGAASTASGNENQQANERDQNRGSKQRELSVAGMPKDMTETGSTTSERSFSSRYKSTTRKMIHRRASIEMYKRIMANNLRKEKRVEISRSNGEFGFRIHGSRPVVVSAIERGTSAETCGLQVGDLIYAINGTNILDMAHSDVVRLAHNDSTALVLDLVPTNDFLRMSKYNRANNRRYEPTVTGFLMRLSPSTAQPLLIELQDQMSRQPGVSSQQRAAKLNQVMRLAWRQRYFVLRNDNCLYWYRTPTDVEPYGGINLQGFSATLTSEFSEPNYVIRLVKYGGQPHYLGSNNMCDIQTWIDAINSAATEANQNDPYMKRTLQLARGKPAQIPEPDCNGYLYKFSHKRGGGAHWRAAYFVLKDACLYLFRDQEAGSVEQASAVYYLHGYRVRSKHIEQKKHTFELLPPNRKTIRPIFLMASNEIDKRRWIAALEYSIDRWIEID